MIKLLVTDELWAVVEPLLPKEPPKPKDGRPRVPDRAALTGILFVLEVGFSWEMLPPRDGLRHDLLAALRRMARGRSVGAPAPNAARLPGAGGRDRAACPFPAKLAAVLLEVLQERLTLHGLWMARSNTNRAIWGLHRVGQLP